MIGSILPAGAAGWFEVIRAGDIVERKKPAPDIYSWVLQQMGLKPREVMAFEDSAHGVTAAHQAGISQIVVTVNDYTRSQDLPMRRSSWITRMSVIHRRRRFCR